MSVTSRSTNLRPEPGTVVLGGMGAAAIAGAFKSVVWSSFHASSTTSADTVVPGHIPRGLRRSVALRIGVPGDRNEMRLNFTKATRWRPPSIFVLRPRGWEELPPSLTQVSSDGNTTEIGRAHV